MLNLKSYLPFFKRVKCKSKDEYAQPETLRKVFEELGGGFLKLGQLLALRPDLVGPKFSKEFEKLFSDVPPEDYELILKLTKDIPLKNISRVPLGSGSVAQVHKATLKGKTVAVKIKRPDVDKKFSQDIRLLEFVAKQVEAYYHPTLIDPIAIVQEFKDYTKQELDLSHEAANIKRFDKNLKKEKNVLIPKVYDEYSNENILIMDFMEGVPINKITKNKKPVIDLLVRVVYKMLFEDRFFHADLHPGNILVAGKKIIFLDFGIAGHIDSSFEKKLFRLFANLVQGDLDGTAESLVELDIGDDEPDLQLLKDGLFNVLADYYDKSLDQLPFEKVFYGAIDVARRSRIRLPSNMVLFGKSLVSLDGTCRGVDPNFNVVKNAKPYVKKLAFKRYSPKTIFKDSKKVIFQMFSMLESLPSGMRSLSRKFTKIEERVIDIDKTFHELNKTIRRTMKLLSMTILFATFFIVSMIFINKPPLLFGFSIFFYAGLLASLILFVGVVDLLVKK